MKVAGACSASESRCVLNAEATTGGDLDSSGSKFDQPCQPVGPGQDIPFATRGQKAFAACGDDIFESLIERDSVIEGPMKSDFERCSQINELACAFNVHRAVGAKDTEDEAPGSKGARMKEIFAHQGELVIRVEKVAASRPQQDMHGESAALNRCARQTVTWREAAFAEGGAEFDAICPSFARGEASLDTLCTELEDNLAH
jgi:hypothetical protein